MSRRGGRTSGAAPSRSAAVPSRSAASPAATVVRGRAAYLAAIALSAVLLFCLELLAGRLVLPVFGGAPAVWTTALCLFTAVLFVGYLYAHLVVTRVGYRRGRWLHLALGVAVAVSMALAPTNLAGLRSPALPEALNVLLVLGLIAGPGVFLLSTTSPLLSAWYAGRGGDPWWLYAVSNAASLVGLLGYPLLIEPWFALSVQRALLVVGIVGLVGLLLTVVAINRWLPPFADRPAESAVPALTTRRQVTWLLAAAVPAGLLSATTSHLAVDLVSAPLLWVGPLAIYLVSLVVAFSARGRRVVPFAMRLAPGAATLMWVSYVLPGSWPVAVLLVFLLSAYGVLAIAVHGRLALDRPDEAHLTRFYLTISAGGLLATAFVALVAPLVFNGIYEYPLLVVGALAVLGFLGAPDRHEARTATQHALEGMRALAPYLAIAAILLVLAAVDNPETAPAIGLVLALGAGAIAVGRTPHALTAATGAAIALALALNWTDPLIRVRTFFGVLEVRTSYFGLARSEFSGTTLHGLQFVDERRSEATTYYVAAGPLGQVMTQLQDRTPNGTAIGAVGLGVGTAAAYLRPSDAITFFEIDQAVVDLARDARFFTYLADAASPPEVVVGDARLSLVDQPAAAFDVLILDAFSSDAVPAHLLTREAIDVYRRTLRPGAVLAFHLSNRYYDLDRAVGSTARSLGLEALVERYVPDPPTPEGLAARPSIWLVAAPTVDLAAFVDLGWTRPLPGPVLTDDFPDLLRTLKPF